MKKIFLFLLLFVSIFTLASCNGDSNKLDENVSDPAVSGKTYTEEEMKSNFSNEVKDVKLSRKGLNKTISEMNKDSVDVSNLKLNNTKASLKLTTISDDKKVDSDVLTAYLWQEGSNIYAGYNVNIAYQGFASMLQLAAKDLYYINLDDLKNASDSGDATDTDYVSLIETALDIDFDTVFASIKFEADDFTYEGNGTFTYKNEKLQELMSGMNVEEVLDGLAASNLKLQFNGKHFIGVDLAFASSTDASKTASVTIKLGYDKEEAINKIVVKANVKTSTTANFLLVAQEGKLGVDYDMNNADAKVDGSVRVTTDSLSLNANVVATGDEKGTANISFEMNKKALKATVKYNDKALLDADFVVANNVITSGKLVVSFEAIKDQDSSLKNIESATLTLEGINEIPSSMLELKGSAKNLLAFSLIK